MRRVRASVLVALAVVGFIAACSDVPSAPQSGTQDYAGDPALHRSSHGGHGGRCTTLRALESLAEDVYGRKGPNVHSVLGKLEGIEKDLKKGKRAKAVERAHDIVESTLKHHRAGRLRGSEARVVKFVNSVYCFVGLDLRFDDASDTHLVLPGDRPQVLRSADLKAGLALPANPVSEPTLIHFEPLPDSFPVPGDGPLDTKLDQYQGFLVVSSSSPLIKPVVVGVCATGAIPQEVRDRLRLGHGKSTGFELAPAAPADFLDCENATGVVGKAGVLSRIGALLSPKPLQASLAQAAARRGGVGGTVTEFSPFAPVDPQVRSRGGVGGTVTEFTRSPAANLFANSISTVESCTSIMAQERTAVSTACRPFVTIKTRLGTSLANVPITWAVTVGGGQVADESAMECGAYASTIVAPTDLFGTSAICWKLGAVGANRVVASPSIGGDVPAGVVFEPASVTFDAVAKPAINFGKPTSVTLITGGGQTGIAGQPLPTPLKVRVTDPYGNPVAGVTVKWLSVSGNGHAQPQISVTDAAGYASTSYIAGMGYNNLKAYIDQFVPAYATIESTGTAP